MLRLLTLCDKMLWDSEGVNQLLVNYMSPDFVTTDVDSVSNFEASCPSKVYEIWHVCERMNDQ